MQAHEKGGSVHHSSSAKIDWYQTSSFSQEEQIAKKEYKYVLQERATVEQVAKY